MKNSFKLPSKFNQSVLTPKSLKALALSYTNLHHTQRDFFKEMSDASWNDVIHDIKAQKPYFQFTLQANYGRFPISEIAAGFYHQVLNDYQKVYGQGAFFFAPLIAIGMQNEVSEYFKTMRAIEITKNNLPSDFI